MGYTHYYYCRKEFNPSDFANVVKDFKKIMPVLEHLGVKLGDYHGENKPIINDKEIAFNGLSKCGHTERDLGITWPSKTAQGVAPLDKQNRLSNQMQDVNGSWFAGAQLETRTCGGDCSHETFRIEQKMENISEWKKQDAEQNKRIFDCCKTAYKPYDLAVTACLIIAKHYLKNEIIIHSDGELKDWQDAINICDHFLGYGSDFKLDPDIEELEKQEKTQEKPKEIIKVDKTKIAVNDVYYSSWGYDQTNIDYYKVLSISPTKKSCKIIRIHSKVIEQIADMIARVVPDPDNIYLDQQWTEDHQCIKVRKEHRALIKTDKDGSIWLRCGQIGGGYLWKYDSPMVETSYA